MEHENHNSDPVETERPVDRQPNTATSTDSTASSTVKNVFIFRNGDRYQPSKKVVVNNRQLRTWDIFLEQVTQSINPMKGAVRNIVTPRGKRRINAFEDLNDKGYYVALSKGERFQNIDPGYGPESTGNVSPISPRRNNTVRLEPIIPVRHNKLYAATTSSRFSEELGQKKSKTLKVYRNGDEFTPAIIVLLKPHEQKTMELVYRAIEDRVVLPSNRAIRKLYSMAGVRILRPDEIEDSKYYVVAGLEMFIERPYGQQLPNLIVGKPHRRNDIKYLNNPKTPAKQAGGRDGGQTTRRGPETTNRSQQQQQQYYQEQQQSRQQNGAVSNRQQQQQQQSQRQPVRQSTDPKAKQKAATEIQSSFRGYKTRKDIAEKQSKSQKPLPITHDPKRQKPKPVQKTPAKTSNKSTTETTKNNQQNRQKPVPKTTNQKPKSSKQEQNKAATQIQAGIKGFNTRKALAETQTNKKLHIAKHDHSHDAKPAAKGKENQKQANNKSPAKSKQGSPQKTPAKKAVSNNDQKNKAATNIQASYKGFKTRKELAEKQTSKPLPTKKGAAKSPTKNDQKNKAATNIQASYKGFKTRKELAEKQTNKPLPTKNGAAKSPTKNNQIKQQANKSDKEKAATTIQSSYKGYKAREQAASKPKNSGKPAASHEDKNKAATTIQSGYKGYKARKDLADKSPKKASNDKTSNQERDDASKKINASLQSYKTRKDLAEKHAHSTTAR